MNRRWNTKRSYRQHLLLSVMFLSISLAADNTTIQCNFHTFPQWLCILWCLGHSKIRLHSHYKCNVDICIPDHHSMWFEWSDHKESWRCIWPCLHLNLTLFTYDRITHNSIMPGVNWALFATPVMKTWMMLFQCLLKGLKWCLTSPY